MSQSIENDAKPVDAPEWVLQLANTPTRAVVAAVAEIELDTAANVERAAAFLKAQPPAIEGQGGDAHTYATAAGTRDLGISEGQAFDLMLEHFNPRCDPPWDWDDLASKVHNAYAYAQNGAGVYAITTTAQETFGPAIAALPVTAPASAIIYPRPLHAGELASRSFPRPSYVLDKLLLAEHVNLLYGDGGTGKTLAALHMAGAVAAGLPLWGLETAQMPVLVALAEDDNGETKARLEAICEMLGVNLADIPLTLWCLPGFDTRLATIADDGTAHTGPFLEPLSAELARLGPCLLILDTVSDFAALDENKRPPVNTLCKVVLTGLCKAFGATVLVNAHPSKTAMADGSGYAGSTAWNNAVRNRLNLERPDARNPRRVLSVAKANYGGSAEIELHQLGLTFVTRADTAGADAQARLLDICVEIALKAADQGAPIQIQRKLNKWMLDEIERVVGYRPSDRDVKEELARALRLNRLRYVSHTRHRVAGYYPFDMTLAHDLAHEAMKVAKAGSGGHA